LQGRKEKITQAQKEEAERNHWAGEDRGRVKKVQALQERKGGETSVKKNQGRGGLTKNTRRLMLLRGQRGAVKSSQIGAITWKRENQRTN